MAEWMAARWHSVRVGVWQKRSPGFGKRRMVGRSEQAMSNPETPVLTVLLPVRNEEMNLRVMLRIIRTVLEYPHEVLVIHDTVDDKSIPIVREAQPAYPGLRLVHNTLGKGVINAIRAGVAEARSDIVTILCADDTGPVLVVDDMLALMRDHCDFVSCTRYAHGGRRLGGSLVGGVLSRRSEEHTAELQSRGLIAYPVFCLKK